MIIKVRYSMNRSTIITDIFFVLAVILFLTYLITKRTGFMACGGTSMIIGSVIMIICTKKSKSTENKDE